MIWCHFSLLFKSKLPLSLAFLVLYAIESLKKFKQIGKIFHILDVSDHILMIKMLGKNTTQVMLAEGLWAPPSLAP